MDTELFKSHCARFIEEISEPPPPPPPPPPVSPVEWQEPSRTEYDAAFARVQNLILQGQIDKAVPMAFARAKVPVTPGMKARWLFEILRAPADLWVYGYWQNGVGVLGATPEILFDLQGRELKTMALAGTLAKEDGSGSDLLRSPKDQAEHRYVVEDLRHELSRWGSHVHVSETRLKELPSLWHLLTELSTTLTEKPEVAELIRRLHPTPALGVFPRQFGWRWMAELPGQEGRGFYGAPFTVCLGENRVRSLVAIRNLQWNERELLLGSGGGVVRDSRMDSEWNELLRKRQSVLRSFGMLK